MKVTVIIIAAMIIGSIAMPSRADDPGLDKKIRGFSFLPRSAREVAGTVRIDVPVACARTDSAHAKDNYPIAAFTAGCGGANPCFTLSLMVMIIPESIRGYHEVVRESLKNDFGPGEVRKIREEVIVSPGSGADKVSLHYGPSFLMGSHIIGCFHSAVKKKTAKVVVGLTYLESFSDEEWRVVLLNSVNILKSLKFMK